MVGMGAREVLALREAAEAFEDRRDVEASLAAFHPDVVWDSTAMRPDGAVHRGHEGVAANMRAFLEGFESVRWKSTEFIDAGEKVLQRIHQAGRGRGSGVEA